MTETLQSLAGQGPKQNEQIRTTPSAQKTNELGEIVFRRRRCDATFSDIIPPLKFKCI